MSCRTLSGLQRTRLNCLWFLSFHMFLYPCRIASLCQGQISFQLVVYQRRKEFNLNGFEPGICQLWDPHMPAGKGHPENRWFVSSILELQRVQFPSTMIFLDLSKFLVFSPLLIAIQAAMECFLMLPLNHTISAHGTMICAPAPTHRTDFKLKFPSSAEVQTPSAF